MTQISDQVLIMLHDVENLPGKKLTQNFRKDFAFSNNIKSKKSSGGNRIKAKHQIIETRHGMPFLLQKLKKYGVSSGALKHQRKVAAKVIKEILDKDIFKEFKQDCAKLNFSAMGDYMEKYKLYHIANIICQYFISFGSSKKKEMSGTKRKSL
jgi:hypothetical protein